LLVLACLANAPALAYCPASAGAQTVLDALAMREPLEAQTQARQKLVDLSGLPRTPLAELDAARMHAVVASASLSLDDGHGALRAVDSALAIVATHPSPDLKTRLELSRALALHYVDRSQEGRAQAEAVASKVIPGTADHACMLDVRGWIAYRSGDFERGLIDLTTSYEFWKRNNDETGRIAAAQMLSQIYRDSGEYAEALRLIDETIANYSRERGAIGQSIGHYTRGTILIDKQDYSSAKLALVESRRLGQVAGDATSVAFADMKLCDAHIRMARYSQARLDCDAALATFRATNDQMMVRETLGHVAELELAMQRAPQALAAIELASPGAARQTLTLPVLLTRARARAGVGQWREAMLDFEEHFERSRASFLALEAQRAAVLRVRFDLARTRDRADNLEAANALQRAELAHTRSRAKWLTWVALASCLSVALLGYILVARRRHQRELLQLATQDELTSLLNRRAILERGAALLSRAQAERSTLCVCVIDIDHFKRINDQLGHRGGDAVLRSFAAEAQRVLRQTDVVARYGGEEFLVLLPGTDLGLAEMILERLRHAAKRIHVAPGTILSISAGIAVANASDITLEQAIARADEALYTAKNEGRDRVRIAA
jgi:diguanylate cyclase (GGDEF)-like protein